MRDCVTKPAEVHSSTYERRRDRNIFKIIEGDLYLDARISWWRYQLQRELKEATKVS